MDDYRNWRSRVIGLAPSLRTVVIFTIFLASWWAFYYVTVLGQLGYLLLRSYNTLELLRPAVIDSTVYWWFFPVYLYVVAVCVSWLISVIDRADK